MTETKKQKRSSSDYFILKIRTYADDRLLNKTKPGEPLPKQHYERAQSFNDFIWSFISYMTKNDKDYWYANYMFDARECALDYIEENFGIMMLRNYESATKWIIPKEMAETIDWIKLNIPDNLPHNVLKRVNLLMYSFQIDKDLKWRRAESLERTKNFMEKEGLVLENGVYIKKNVTNNP